MPIDSIAGLRHLSQAQGSFVRLDQSTDKLQTTTDTLFDSSGALASSPLSHG